MSVEHVSCPLLFLQINKISHDGTERTAPSKTKDRMSSVSLLMGVESNSGTADARAADTWPSVEVAARLSPLPNFSFMCQSFDSRIFELGDCFVAQSSPGWATWVTSPRADGPMPHCFRLTLQSVFVPQYWPTLQTFSRCQLSKKYLLWNPTVWHAHNVTDPSKLRFKQESFYTYNTTGVQYICVGNSILPLGTSQWRRQKFFSGGAKPLPFLFPLPLSSPLFLSLP